MNTLVSLTHNLNTQYDWFKITDACNRTAAKSAVDVYVKEFDVLRDKADKLIKDNTVALARCVYELKAILPHGEFADVCENALKLNKDKRAALVHIGQQVLNGSQAEEVLEMVQHMEPRAAQKLLKADEETKSRYVANYQETGKLPSQKSFEQKSHQCELSNQPKQVSEPTQQPYVAPKPPSPEEQLMVCSGIVSPDEQAFVVSLLNNENLSFIDTIEKAIGWRRFTSMSDETLLGVVQQKCSQSSLFTEKVKAIIEPSEPRSYTTASTLDNTVRNGVRFRR